ncbi:MAG: Dam family site-specific DNA-(adenine-N6)-methyltransferase [Dehalococcoidia bacterium]|nr:Dam family site-specific DNA-(adenine-N6)-methyltransferase [Dehalococcoidia bacterium]
MQMNLFNDSLLVPPKPFHRPLLKWIGNKQRFAHKIASHFPDRIGTYFEPFLGSGAVLGTISPSVAVATDSFRPLMEIWSALHRQPEVLKAWYRHRWYAMDSGDKKEEYERIRDSYNYSPNGADLLFLSRSCYGGVIRFRQADGYMSTPCGAHKPILPNTFDKRVEEWHLRTKGARFEVMEFEAAMKMAKAGDLIYCDPPYSYSQSILYGAQSFSLDSLFQVIVDCKARGVYVALSIDGTKKSGQFVCDVPMPDGLFEREVFIDAGQSMLKRFQMKGHSLESEFVRERLLLTY